MRFLLQILKSIAFAANMPNGRRFIQGRPFEPGYS
jgi:hypothetical protein